MVILGPDQAILLFSIDSPPESRSLLPRTSSSAHVTTSPVLTELRLTYTTRNGHLTTFSIGITASIETRVRQSNRVQLRSSLPRLVSRKNLAFVKQPVPDHRTVVIAPRVRVRAVSFFGFSVGLLHSASEQGDFKIASPTDALMDGGWGKPHLLGLTPSCDA